MSEPDDISRFPYCFDNNLDILSDRKLEIHSFNMGPEGWASRLKQSPFIRRVKQIASAPCFTFWDGV